MVSVSDGDDNLCRACSTNGKNVRMLRFRWKVGSVPMHVDPEPLICVLCDSEFRQDMNVRLLQPNQVVTTLVLDAISLGISQVAVRK